MVKIYTAAAETSQVLIFPIVSQVLKTLNPSFPIKYSFLALFIEPFLFGEYQHLLNQSSSRATKSTVQLFHKLSKTP